MRLSAALKGRPDPYLLPVLVFVLWSVRRFVVVFSPRGTQPRVAALFLLLTLLLWGVRPWFYSGMFNRGTLSLALAWPSLLAFGLMLTVWRGRRPADLALLAVAAGISISLAALWPYYSLTDLLVSPAAFEDITRNLFVHKVAFFGLLGVGLPVLAARSTPTASTPS